MNPLWVVAIPLAFGLWVSLHGLWLEYSVRRQSIALNTKLDNVLDGEYAGYNGDNGSSAQKGSNI